MPKLKPIPKKIAQELKDMDMELMEDIPIEISVVCCPFCFELHGHKVPSFQNADISHLYSCGECGLTVSLQ